MKNYAVLVGTNNFENFPNIGLKYCESDVVAMHKCLTTNENFKTQFLAGDIKTITGHGVSRLNVYEQISELFSRATTEDQIWLFIASHGYVRKNENFIYTHDAMAGSDAVKDASCLNLGEIRGLLSESKAAKKFVFLDCCHASSANFIQRDAGEDLFSMRRARSEFSGRTFAFFNSTAEGQLAHECDKLKQGVWSHFLVRALNGEQEAWVNGTTLTVDSLQSYLVSSVSQYCKNEFGTKQTPDIELKGTGGTTVIAHIQIDTVFEATFEKNCALAKNKIHLLDREFFPILVDLERHATAVSIRALRDKWDRLLNQNEEVPVAMIGMVGCGKTTLLNAVTGCQIGLAGEGSAKSAAILVVRRSEEAPKIVVKYIDLDEVQSVLDEIFTFEEDDFGYFPDDDDLVLSESQFRELSELLVEPSSYSGQRIKLNDLNLDIREKIENREETIALKSKDISEISATVRDFSDSNGAYWRITRSIEVTGPFPGLEPGMTIMDLPGFGDLDALRIRRAKEALAEVHQVIVVTGGRGIYDDVRNTLKQVGLMTSILMNPRLEQIIFVGTKIDAGRVSISDQSELGLDSEYGPKDAVEAQFEQWRESTSSQWKKLIEVELRRARTGHHVPADEIFQNTKFVPISPDGYLCLSGLQRDPTGTYHTCFAQGDLDYAETTGISEVRQIIRKLLVDQKRLKFEKLLWEDSNVTSSVNFTCEELLLSLVGEIELSEDENRSILKFLASVGKLSSNDYFVCKNEDSIKDTVYSFAKEILPELKERWGGLKATTISKTLLDNYGKLNYNTLAASFRREGHFRSKGKQGLTIDMPEKIDYAVRQVLVSMANWNILPEVETKLSERTTQALDGFLNNLDDCLKELRERNFGSKEFLAEIDSIITQFRNSNRKIQNELVDRIGSLRDDSARIARNAVGLGFGPIMVSSLNKVSGRGARRRIIEEMARRSEASIGEICGRTTDEYCKLMQAAVEVEFDKTKYAVGEQIKHTFLRLEEAYTKSGGGLGVSERRAFLERVVTFRDNFKNIELSLKKP